MKEMIKKVITLVDCKYQKSLITLLGKFHVSQNFLHSMNVCFKIFFHIWHIGGRYRYSPWQRAADPLWYNYPYLGKAQLCSFSVFYTQCAGLKHTQQPLFFFFFFCSFRHLSDTVFKKTQETNLFKRSFHLRLRIEVLTFHGIHVSNIRQ